MSDGDTTNHPMERVARHLLLSSPPGQFDAILADLKVLIPSSVLTSSFCAQVFEEYESRSGHSLLTKEIDSSSISEFGKLLQSKLKDHYIASHFDKSLGVVAKSQVVMVDQEKETIEVTIYAERVNLKNYHAGSWKTVFTITADESSSSAQIQNGCVTIRAHTFENGNVQFSTEIPLPSTSINSSSGDLVDSIIQRLETWDKEYILRPIHDFYDTMSQTTLKSLRRIMPVTRTKFDWNVASHRFVHTLTTDVAAPK